jgi:multimeric flavodoxin WrbA
MRNITRRNAIKAVSSATLGAITLGAITSCSDKTTDDETKILTTNTNNTNMKVLLINGSPHKEGCTYTALSEIATSLKSQNIDSQIYWLGKDAIAGCIGCRVCSTTGKCFVNDSVNEVAALCETIDGFIFGSPVHYASASGFITPFMDRLFYAHGDKLTNKPAAAIVSCRRAGSTAALDQLNKYFTINCMPVVSSQYWNMVHGNTPDEVRQDLEGMQIMRMLGANMAWLLKCIKAGKDAGIQMPNLKEKHISTNFIR